MLLLEMGIEPDNEGSGSVRFGHCDSSVRFGFGCQTLWVRSVRFGIGMAHGVRVRCVRFGFGSIPISSYCDDVVGYGMLQAPNFGIEGLFYVCYHFLVK